MALNNLLTMPLDFSKALPEKYRPHRMADFIGLEAPKRIMASFIARPRPDAWFFVGPSGTGKTTMALAVCEAIKGELHHIPSRSCDLETIENTCRMCQYIPIGGGLHVILVDEADQMTGAAQLALLSKLDATAMPPNTVFFFTSNGTQLLEPRFLSRCKVIEFKEPKAHLAAYLAKIYKTEGGKYPVKFTEIAQQVGNNVRDALGKIEMELMLGSDRDGIPSDDTTGKESHNHKCGACGVRYQCETLDCGMAYASKSCRLGGRPPCAGATMEGAERARRAWQTRKEKKR